MLSGELAEDVKDMLLDVGCLLLGIIGVVRDNRRRKVGIVDGVVDGEGNLEASVVVDHRSGDTSPHRLMNLETRNERVVIRLLTVR